MKVFFFTSAMVKSGGLHDEHEPGYSILDRIGRDFQFTWKTSSRGI
jgi:hypothetical protein